MSGPDRAHQRPPGVGDATVAALGKLSEALECVEDARGHLYAFHRAQRHRRPHPGRGGRRSCARPATTSSPTGSTASWSGATSSRAAGPSSSSRSTTTPTTRVPGSSSARPATQLVGRTPAPLRGRDEGGRERTRGRPATTPPTPDDSGSRSGSADLSARRRRGASSAPDGRSPSGSRVALVAAGRVELRLGEEERRREVGAGEVGVAQVGTEQVGPGQDDVAQVGGDQQRAAQVGAARRSVRAQVAARPGRRPASAAPVGPADRPAERAAAGPRPPHGPRRGRRRGACGRRPLLRGPQSSRSAASSRAGPAPSAAAWSSSTSISCSRCTTAKTANISARRRLGRATSAPAYTTWVTCCPAPKHS